MSTESEPVSPTIIKSTSWIEKMPAGMRPYAYLMRVDMPIGSMLLFYPCAWSITMASYAVDAPLTTPLFYTALAGIGALVFHGAGSTINDIWDRNFDKAVERTQNRPLARGDVSVKRAFAFLALETAVGVAVLAQLNTYSLLLGMSSFPLIVIYPLMKRVMDLPQLVLGLTFNWGALLGWATITASVDWSVCLPLYLGGVCWTLVYDTIYAHQDKADDIRVGVRSTALLLGKHTRTVLLLLACTAFACALLAVRANTHDHTAAWVGAAFGGVQLIRVVHRAQFDVGKSCWEGFVGCGWFGFWLWMGALADFVLLKML